MVAQKTTSAAVDEHDAFLEVHKLDQMGKSAFKLDAHEVENVIELTAEVPGVHEGDIELDLEGSILTISVEKRSQSDGKHKHFSERSYGHFQRSIQLPFTPDGKSVTANVENGILTVRFPRVETERTRRIAIGGAHLRPEASRERGAIGSAWRDNVGAEEPLTLTEVAGTSATRAPPPPPPKLPRV